MKKIAIYPGSFDPITLGHVAVIERAAQLFDRLVVAVALSERKRPCIAVQDRVALVTETLKAIPNVQVVVLSGLLADLAIEHGAGYAVKGLRNGVDFDYERQQAWMNQSLSSSSLETVCLFADDRHDKVSSTMVREIVALGGDVAAFVPAAVIDYLQKKK